MVKSLPSSPPHVGYAQIIGVVGATGTGKSALALRAAASHPVEILNGDSLQVYRGLDIGTAKPTQEERGRCPHHLFDIVSAPETWSAGDFRRSALEVIRNGSPKKTLLLVGGSGFYLQALTLGMFEAPALDPAARELLRQRTRDVASEQLHFDLAKTDPRSAERIHPQDRYRILRALEVFEASGKTLSQIQREFVPEPLPIRWLGLSRPRENQAPALRRRIHLMFRSGWLEEVDQLLKQGHEHWPPLQSVGYREIVQAIASGRIDLQSLQELITVRHLQLSKKQSTWFQRLPPENTRWFDAETEPTAAEDLLDQWLQNPP